MSGESKFSSKRPKGDAWGVGDAVASAAEEFRRTGKSPMIPFVGVLCVSKIEMTAGDDGHPVYLPIVEIRRANSLDTPESIRAGQKLILQAIKDQEGDEDAVKTLPLDEREIIMSAFGAVDSGELEQDDRELLEAENMSEPDNLRRHLATVHRMDATEVNEMEWVDVQKTHQSAHDPLAADVMPHDVEWWAWRRIVLAERASELKTEGITWDKADETADVAEVDDETEIRTHLIGVHDFDSSVIEGESLADLRARHVRDHEEPDVDNPFPAHDLADLRPTPDGLDSAEAGGEDQEHAADSTPAADETHEG